MKTLPESAKLCENVYVVDVTPELAARWLKRNPFNRNLVPSRCYRYCQQMELGLWRLTHQGLAFDKNEMLVDGQNRLTAVCMSKKTVRMLVFTNIEYSLHEVIDAGKPRTNLDVLQMEANDQSINSAVISTLAALVAGRHCRTLNLGSIEIDRYYKAHKDR